MIKEYGEVEAEMEKGILTPIPVHNSPYDNALLSMEAYARFLHWTSGRVTGFPTKLHYILKRTLKQPFVLCTIMSSICYTRTVDGAGKGIRTPEGLRAFAALRHRIASPAQAF